MSRCPTGRGPGTRRVPAANPATALAFLFAPLLLALPDGSAAQEPAAGPSPAAGLDDFAWLTGSWRGPGPNGSTAEIHFMPPRAGTLPSLFRLRQDGRVVVLETITLVREPDGLFMYVRHFSPDLVPLEKEEALRLRLVERRGDAFHFENTVEGRNPRTTVMTRTREGFVSRSVLTDPDGGTREIRVEYRREGG